MQVFNFIVLSITVAHHSVFTPHISKTICLFRHLMYMNSNWIDVQKASEGKWEAPQCVGLETQLPRKTLRFIKRSSLSL